MLTFYKKYWRTAFDIALIVLTVYLIMFTFSYLYKIAAPILLSLVVYVIIEPFAKFLNKWGVKKSLASAISILLFSLIILGAIVGVGAIFTAQISSLIDKIPKYSVILQKQIVESTLYLQQKVQTLPPDLADKVNQYTSAITQKGGEWARAFLLMLFGMLSSVSAFVVNLGIAVILAYFLSIEIKSWKRMAREKTPYTFTAAFYFLKENVLVGIVGYLKAQLKLISLTFIIVFIALLALRVHNSFTIALLSAFFDVLPLLGVSTVFIPWIIYLLFVGQTTLAFWLIGLLAVVLLTRQILEPKITGDTLGVSAFTMLSFMIISLSLFGVAGLILSPVLIILIKALYEQGYLRKWIHLPAEEFDRY